MSLQLEPIAGYPTLGGAVRADTGVGAGEGTAIAIGDPISPLRYDQAPQPRDNSGRTVCVTFTRHTLVGGKHTLYGRGNPTNEDTWTPIMDLLTGAPVSEIAIEDGDGAITFVYKLAWDAREIRVDRPQVTSGTIDVDVAVMS